MPISLQFYLDANLTTPMTSALQFEQATDGSTGAQTRIVYLGSTANNRMFESEMNPGVDSIILSVVDNQPGVGQEAQNVKLALNPNDLINTAAGAPLALPATILSGVINAIPIYIQVENTQGVVSVDTSLSLVTSSIMETANTP